VSRPLYALAGAALLAAASARAQSIPNINAPKQAAQRAAAATDAHIAAQTGQAVPSRAPSPAPATQPPGSGPRSRPTVLGASPSQSAIAKIPQQVTREIFTYEPAGRRDPFFSLILTEDLRPLLTDLKLVGILYEPTGRRSVAIFRDVLTNAQYRVQTGMTLGRMRVAQIKPKGVIFTIDEFGLSRQDSLMMMDTTKVRN
jgi:hypothetical protein